MDRSAEHPLVRPIVHTTGKYFLWVAVPGLILLLAGIAYTTQLVFGLHVTGLNRPNYWGLYVVNFVFFIGISHAGTLISAILRVTHAGWRTPVTRIAEAITVFALMIGPLNVMIHLGHIERVWMVIWHGNLRAPILWDVISITVYMLGSMLYLYIPMIPDLARLRDTTKTFLRPVYRLLAIGFTGTEKQYRRLHRAVAVMAVAIIPIAISVHTVVSWVFAMTVQPMWHSTIFGPYFVVGAIFSGIAALLIAMVVVRKAFRLEEYLKPIHFNNLALLLLTMGCLWGYFTFAEYLTTYYGDMHAEMAVWWSKISGEYSVMFWVMWACCFVIPLPILAFKRTRTIPGICFASVLITIGMWIERFLIIVPTLARPRLEGAPQGSYTPSWVEISITAGEFAALVLLFVLFSKVFPLVSIWETEHEKSAGAA